METGHVSPIENTDPTNTLEVRHHGPEEHEITETGIQIQHGTVLQIQSGVDMLSVADSSSTANLVARTTLST